MSFQILRFGRIRKELSNNPVDKRVETVNCKSETLRKNAQIRLSQLNGSCLSFCIRLQLRNKLS